MLKKLFMIAMALMFSMGLFVGNVYAVDSDHGSITVYLEQSVRGTSIANVEFDLIKVGEVVDGEYELVDSLKNVELNLNDLTNAEKLKEGAEVISTAVETNNVSGVKKATDSKGIVKYDNLELGVYLLKSLNTKTYDHVSPALIAIPTFDSTKNNPNDMTYDIDVVPKHSVRLAKKAVKTGDSTNTTVYAMMGVVAVAGIALATVIKKKEEVND